MSYLKRAVVPIAVIAVILSAMAGIWLHARTPQAAAAISIGCGQWTLVPGANPGTVNDQLFGIAAVSANDIWAVGVEGPQAPSPNVTLTEHWNGTAWNLVPSPNVSTAEDSRLESVAAFSATDVWAVGYYFDPASNQQLTLTEHWNGSSWSIVPSPDDNQAPDNYLSSVSADASNDVWAVGYSLESGADAPTALIEHWNGSNWAVVPAATPYPAELNSVVALSATNAWTVGMYWGNTGVVTHIEHWDGTSWTNVSSPNASQGGDYLYGVTAAGPSNIWAVGSQELPNSPDLMTLTEHWDGTAWTVVPSYTTGTNTDSLAAATTVPGTQQILAVGSDSISGGNTVSLAERWNGTTWTHMQTSNQSSTVNDLYDVAAVSASAAWAVGSYVPSSSATTSGAMRMRQIGLYTGIPQEQVLILHYQAPAMGILCP